jgi:hypothetical protein
VGVGEDIPKLLSSKLTKSLTSHNSMLWDVFCSINNTGNSVKLTVSERKAATRLPILYRPL